MTVEGEKMREKIIQFLVWKLPARFLLWAVIRGFADASQGEHSDKHVDELGYNDVYSSIVKKYGLKRA